MSERIVDAVEEFTAKRIQISEGDPPEFSITNGFSLEDVDMSGVKYMSAQRIGKLIESPRHYEWRYILGNKDGDTPAKRLGKLTHWALLEPKAFLSRYVIQPKFKGAGMKKAKADWLKSLPKNAIILGESDANEISHMIEALHSHPRASKLLSKGTPEVRTFYADHEFKDEAGRPLLWFGIMDFYRSGNWIVEIKTTRCAKRKEFIRDFYQNKYHIQLWKYRRAVHGITGKMPDVAVIAIENSDPNCVEIFEPKQGMWDQANYEVTLALDSYKECLESGYWHSYSKDPIPVSHPPDWLKSRFDTNEE